MFDIKLLEGDDSCISDTLALCLEQWNWFMDSKRHWWAVAFTQSEPKLWVAYAGLSIYDKDTIYIGPDYVTEPARGHGLQKQLLEFRHEWAKQNGYSKTIAVVAHDNHYSSNNFLKTGYLLRSPWPGFSDSSTYLFYEKKL
jgi:GNAT superfamily N-acetyltransferase